LSQEDGQKWIVERQADVAAVFSVSPSSVKDWAARGMPGETGNYPLPAVAKWLRTAGPWAPKVRNEAEDPLLTTEAGDSPNLERYRAAKAALAEYELAQKTGSLMAVDKARKVFLRWAQLIRNAGERVGKRHGPDAAEAINEALQECETVIDDELADNSTAE